MSETAAIDNSTVQNYHQDSSFDYVTYYWTMSLDRSTHVNAGTNSSGDYHRAVQTVTTDTENFIYAGYTTADVDRLRTTQNDNHSQSSDAYSFTYTGSDGTVYSYDMTQHTSQNAQVQNIVTHYRTDDGVSTTHDIRFF